MSKAAEEYVEKLVLSRYTESETIPNITQRYYHYEDMVNSFDAGVASVTNELMKYLTEYPLPAIGVDKILAKLKEIKNDK